MNIMDSDRALMVRHGLFMYESQKL